ncbi:MAG: zinc-ribbon domain-containing protein [Oscillospiraceae bacterium]|nr:zinc-ribbon domain-containing protein [Oscillospiraceae bacterium]
MYCAQCGNEVKDGNNFCAKCGKKIVVKTTEKTDVDVVETKAELESQILERKNNPEIRFKCKYCSSENLKREKREGCLSYIGGCIGGSILLWIFIALEWKTLTSIYAVIYILYLFIDPLCVFYQLFIRPKWYWDIVCNDCKKEFVWDSSLNKYKDD